MLLQFIIVILASMHNSTILDLKTRQTGRAVRRSLKEKRTVNGTGVATATRTARRTRRHGKHSRIPAMYFVGRRVRIVGKAGVCVRAHRPTCWGIVCKNGWDYRVWSLGLVPCRHIDQEQADFRLCSGLIDELHAVAGIGRKRVLLFLLVFRGSFGLLSDSSLPFIFVFPFLMLLLLLFLFIGVQSSPPSIQASLRGRQLLLSLSLVLAARLLVFWLWPLVGKDPFYQFISVRRNYWLFVYGCLVDNKMERKRIKRRVVKVLKDSLPVWVHVRVGRGLW